MSIYVSAFATTDALERAGIEHMIVGSLAAMYYGLTRNTMDADFVVRLGTTSIQSVTRQLGSGYTLDPQPRFEVFTNHLYFVVNVEDTPFNIDFFLLSDDPFDRESFERRRKVALEGHDVFFPSAEDVVVQKLRWGRLKDQSDLQEVLALQGAGLDFAYIERWCDAHGTRALLDKLRSEIPPL